MKRSGKSLRCLPGGAAWHHADVLMSRDGATVVDHEGHTAPAMLWVCDAASGGSSTCPSRGQRGLCCAAARTTSSRWSTTGERWWRSRCAPSPRRALSSRLWADDYDTLLKLRVGDWAVLAATRLQPGPPNVRYFIGELAFSPDEAVCAV